MATKFSNALVGQAGGAAVEQANAQFIEDLLVTTGGWVVTGDTGQTAPGSITMPSPGVNLKLGYRIYRMNDALQASFPVFLKLIWATGGTNSNPWAFGFHPIIGTGSNGSGGITGILFDHSADAAPSVTLPNNTSPGQTTASNSYGSADLGRVALAMFVQSNGGYITVFGLERSKDANGNDTGDGLQLVFTPGYNNSIIGATWTNGQGCLAAQQYFVRAGGTQPHLELGLNFVITGQNPSDTFAGNIGIGVLQHFAGIAVQPGLNFAVCKSNDISAESSITLPLYGVNHTYQHLNGLVPSIPTNTSNPGGNPNIMPRADCRILMRYD